MRIHICETLLTACVNSHLTDPQGKWTTSTATSNLLNAFIDASGVPYWVANIVVMEKCADIWLTCLADISRSYLRPNLASHPFVVCEVTPRDGREDRVTYKPHRVSGNLTRLVEEFNNPYGNVWDERLRMTYIEKETAFFKFLYERLAKQPDLLAGYAPEVTEWATKGIEDHLTSAQRRGIDLEIQRAAEEAERAAEEYREKVAAEQAAHAKRAAAAAARKARKAGAA